MTSKRAMTVHLILPKKGCCHGPNSPNRYSFPREVLPAIARKCRQAGWDAQKAATTVLNNWRFENGRLVIYWGGAGLGG